MDIEELYELGNSRIREAADRIWFSRCLRGAKGDFRDRLRPDSQWLGELIKLWGE